MMAFVICAVTFRSVFPAVKEVPFSEPRLYASESWVQNLYILSVNEDSKSL